MKEYNCKIIQYDEGYKIVTYNENRIISAPSLKQTNDAISITTLSEEAIEKERKKRQQRYLFEVKARISDLILANLNDFKTGYFFTLTFNPEYEKHLKTDFDKNQFRIQLFQKFIRKNQDRVKYLKKNYSDKREFKYIFVPELHSGEGVSKGLIHFHGLVSGFIPRLEDTGHLKGKKKIYKSIDWKWGYSYVLKIDENTESVNKVASYISKYILKSMTDAPVVPKNKNKYWCSRNLKKPKRNYLKLSAESINEIQKSVCDVKEYKNENCNTIFINKKIEKLEEILKNTPSSL